MTAQTEDQPPPRAQGGNGETFPANPREEEILEDWRWIAEQRAKGEFDQYAGKHIAVLGKKVWEAGRDTELLVKYVALKYQLDPERLVIAYIDRW